MELRQLRYLVALADAGQFTRAARALRIAQPALSQQIGRLERELGFAVVDRTPRGATLTDAGVRVVARARVVLAEVAALEDEAGTLAGLRGGRVVLGVTPTTGALDVAGILAAFHRAHPAVEIAVREDLSVALADRLRAGDLDVAFMTASGPVDVRGLDTTPVSREPLVAVVPPGHALAGRRRLALRDLAGEPFVGFRPGATIRATLESALGGGPALRLAFETGDVMRLRELVAAGLAVGVLPRSDAERSGPPVVAVPIAPTLAHEVVLASRAGRTASPSVAAFAAHAAG
jgi:LysR family transcriptional regulator, transcription activator of glutamate synthase operon